MSYNHQGRRILKRYLDRQYPATPLPYQYWPQIKPIDIRVGDVPPYTPTWSPSTTWSSGDMPGTTGEGRTWDH